MKSTRAYILIIVSLFLSSCTSSKKSITIRWAVNEELLDIGRELSRAYMEDHPHTSVILMPLPPSHREQKKELDAYIKNKSIDIYTVDTQGLEYLLDSQYIAPIKRKYMHQNPQDYFKGIMKLCEIDYHTLYAFPLLADTSALFYREDLLTEFKLPPPRTWDEFASISKEIKKDKKQIIGLMVNGKDELKLTTLFIEALWSHGLDAITDEGDTMLDLPQVILLLKKWKKYIKNKIISKKITEYTHAQAIKEFQNGTSIFYYGTLSDWKFLDDPYKTSDTSYTFAFSSIPGTEDYEAVSILDASVLALSIDSPQKDESIKFMNFLISFPSQEIILMNDWIPAMKKVFEESEAVQYKPRCEDMISILDSAEPFPLHRITPTMLSILQQNIRSIFKNKISPVEGMYTAMKKIRYLPRIQSVRRKKKKIKKSKITKKIPTTSTSSPSEKGGASLPATTLQQTITGLVESPEPKPLTGLQEFREPKPLTGLTHDKELLPVTGLTPSKESQSITGLIEKQPELKNSYTEPTNGKEKSVP